jgi:hypothetical protein
MELRMSETKNPNAAVGSVISLLVLIGIGWYLFGGGADRQAAHDMQQISNSVAADAVKQYEIAKRNGNATDAYVQASLVAAAFL